MADRLPFYVYEVPRYEARDGLIWGFRNGSEFVFPLEIACKTVAALNRAIDECYESRGVVRHMAPLRKV